MTSPVAGSVNVNLTVRPLSVQGAVQLKSLGSAPSMLVLPVNSKLPDDALRSAELMPSMVTAITSLDIAVSATEIVGLLAVSLELDVESAWASELDELESVEASEVPVTSSVGAFTGLPLVSVPPVDVPVDVSPPVSVPPVPVSGGGVAAGASGSGRSTYDMLLAIPDVESPMLLLSTM